MDEKQFAFGAVESHNDPRTISSADIATSVVLAPSGKVELNVLSTNQLCDQQALGICTMCAVRMAAEHHFNDGIRLSEYWGYLIGKVYLDDPVFGEFEGSSAFTMLKAANKYGIPSKRIERVYPLKTDGTYAQFIADFHARYGGKIPADVLADAQSHIIAGYYRIFPDAYSGAAPSATGMRTEILNGRVVITRMAVGESFYTDANGNYSRQAKDLLPLRAPKTIEGGHLIDLNEFWRSGAEFGGPNSWSNTWCVGNAKQQDGYYWYEFETQRPYVTEAWAILDRNDKYVFSKDLTMGSTGPDVVALQKYLVKVGLMTMPAGVSYGFFGGITRDGVIAYQRKYNITPIAGFFGPKTRAHLNANQ